MRPLAVLASVVAIVACSSEQNVPTEFETTVPLYAKGGSAPEVITPHLSGDQEVLAGEITPALSEAQGQAIFRIRGTTLEFRLIASNIHNVIMSHIHCDVPGANGPIAQWLFPQTTGGPQLPNPGIVDQDGVLASGTIDLAGVNCPIDTAAGGADNPANGVPLLTAIRNGWTYVNVHTNDGVAPANTGPGDFPGGEIRGQLNR
ncbi:MAG TPA: CHRD domain-containing protein [Gemmatimonadaceae bacterium]|nr:CHRD domain-containing protein [Gemmatimonadaceae bacterium]